MIVSLDNLRVGIEWWLSKGWPHDFHNSFYHDIYDSRSTGLDQDWWNATVGRLGQWKAYRGLSPPNTRADILARGNAILERLSTHYTDVRTASNEEPSIMTLDWGAVAPLFDLAFSIKPSEVFAGKLCHFMLPKAFFVMDNQATGVFDYEFLWRGLKDEFSRFTNMIEARTLLATSMQCKKDLHPEYPFETKITELCCIGRHCR